MIGIAMLAAGGPPGQPRLEYAVMLVICIAMLLFVGFRIGKLERLRVRRSAPPEQEMIERWRRIEARAQWWRFAGWLLGAAALVAGSMLPLEAGALARLACLAPLLAGLTAGEFLSHRAKRILDAAGVSKQDAMGRNPKGKEWSVLASEDSGSERGRS